MVKVELTTKQAEELKNHYILELEKLQQRSAEILSLLKSIGQESASAFPTDSGRIAKPLPVAAAPATTAPSQPAENKPKRRGRPTNNPPWSEYVVDLLKEKEKPLTKEQIFKTYQKQHGINLAGSKSAMASLNQALQRLRVRKNLITSIPREGKRGNFYKLNTNPVAPVEEKKPAQEVKEVKAVKKPTEEKGSKYNWPQFIVDTLIKTKRVLTRKDFLNHAMVHFSIPDREKSATLGKISPVITQMVKGSKRLKTVKKPGFRGSHYGLVEWFDDNKKLIPEFK